MSNTNDTAGNVREEDALNKHKLAVYLANHLDGFSMGDELNIQQFSGGASNLTYLLQWQDQQVILRTAPKDVNIKSAHDMAREHKVLSLLQGHFAYSPKPLLMCEDVNIIGRPFYLMQKITGIIPRKSFPMPVSPTQALNMCKQLIEVQVALHEIDIKKTSLTELGRPQGYIQRQIKGWNNRYNKALIKGSLPAQELMGWLQDNQPKDQEASLIHNDYKFDNVVLSAHSPHEIIAVLDWEMATVGSPLMDLGCSMAYWIEKNDPAELQAIRTVPTNIQGMMTRKQIFEYYTQQCSKNTANLQFSTFNYFYVFGLFRLAVIVQQIYKRYATGKTTNPAFKHFGEIAKVLIIQAEKQYLVPVHDEL